MPKGSRGVTSIDVAKAAGVSQTTVSRVLNGHPSVSPKMHAQVQDAIARLGYRPNLSARSLVTSRTQTVGVVLGDPTNSYYAELLQTVSEELRRAGYRTLMLSDRLGGVEDLATILWESDVDGIIVTTTLLSPEDEARLVSLDVPAVTMGPDALPDADSISPDNLTGGRIAAAHLLDLGHERIGVIAGPLDAASVRDRHAGFLAELDARGIELDASLLDVGDLEYDRAYTAATSMLRREDAPTAVFCHNDLLAFASLNAAAALGLSVPDDVSVLGFDDVRMAAWESFRLTTIRQPIREMAVGAVESLLARFRQPEQDVSHITLPCLLVERATTGAPRSPSN